MAEIITFGSSEDKKIESIKKEGFKKKFKDFIQSFKSLDRFTKIQILTITLVIAATPALIAGYLIFHPKADTFSGSLGTAIIYKSPYGTFNIYTGQTGTTPPNYSVDPEVLKQFNSINNARATAGLPPLSADKDLTCAANKQTADEDAYNYFGHQSPDHNNLNTWNWAFTPCGILSFGQAGENIGEDNFGPSDADSDYMFNLFMSSPEHKANILGTIWKSVGISRHYDSSQGVWLWTVEFLTDKISPVVYVAQISTPSPTPTNNPTSTPIPTLSPTPTPTPTALPTGAGCINGYRDQDGDGYGMGSYGCYSGVSVVQNNSDCYDQNTNAHPGQTLGFTVSRGDGSFDYNCNGTATPTNAGGGNKYSNYTGTGTPGTALSYKNSSTSICTNGTYTSFWNNVAPITSTDCGKSVTIGPCNYAYYGSQSCSGTVVGYNQCSSRIIACN